MRAALKAGRGSSAKQLHPITCALHDHHGEEAVLTSTGDCGLRGRDQAAVEVDAHLRALRGSHTTAPTGPGRTGGKGPG